SQTRTVAHRPAATAPTPSSAQGGFHTQGRRTPRDLSDPHTDTAALDESRLITERRTKLDRLREAGPAYPNDFRPDSHAATLHADCDALDEDALQALGREALLAGRMMLKLVLGYACFATLQYGTGLYPHYTDCGVMCAEA